MKYFTIAELSASTTAKAKGIDNTPDETITAHLTELVDGALDSVRECWGKPVKITSGYRCQALNKAIGGAKNSAHITGYAADTKPSNGDMSGYQKCVLKWAETHQFDQIILEYPTKNLSKWIHIGYMNSSGKQRKQIIYTPNGRNYYNVAKGSKFYKV